MDVSVIIINYNTLDVTRNCINSIFSKTEGLAFEVILVDNSSKDGSKDVFVKDSRIKYLYSDKNIGFGKANNLGLSIAKGEYVLFLNSDTLLLNNAIKIMYEKIREKKDIKIGAIGCMLSDPNGTIIHSYGRFLSMSRSINDALYAIIKNPFKKINYIPQGTKAYGDFFKVDYVTGADLFVPMKIIKEFGAFDPAFFMYCEDCYMQYVYTKHGYDSYITTEPKIVHLESISTLQNSDSNIYKKILIERSRFIYFKKTSSAIHYLMFRFFYFLLRTPFILKPHICMADKKAYFFMLIKPVNSINL